MASSGAVSNRLSILLELYCFLSGVKACGGTFICLPTSTGQPKICSKRALSTLKILLSTLPSGLRFILFNKCLLPKIALSTPYPILGGRWEGDEGHPHTPGRRDPAPL